MEIDALNIQDDVIQASRGWSDDLGEQLQDTLGEPRAREVLSLFSNGFPPGYSNRFNADTAVVDLQYLLALNAENPLAMSFYQRQDGDAGLLHCKLYHFGGSLPLSDVMPILDNLGLRVLGEFPFQITRSDGQA